MASVRIEGATRTRPSFLDWLVKPHLKDVQTSESDLESVLLTARKITHSLLATDNFSSVLPRLEASRDVLASEGDVELVFQTRQKGRYFLKTATEVGSQEGSVVSIYLASRYSHQASNKTVEYPRSLAKHFRRCRSA